ncbi:MAG: holo-ACP synthase [Pseudomonadota bacterium]
MIYGIGVDLIKVARLEKGLARYGMHYADRLLAPEEHQAFFSAAEPARFLAKRFAAKEAFAKAAGTGLRHPLHLRSIAVTHSELGQPALRFGDELSCWLQGHGIIASHLSLSDEREYVIACVVLEKS